MKDICITSVLSESEEGVESVCVEYLPTVREALGLISITRCHGGVVVPVIPGIRNVIS